MAMPFSPSRSRLFPHPGDELSWAVTICLGKRKGLLVKYLLSTVMVTTQAVSKGKERSKDVPGEKCSVIFHIETDRCKAFSDLLILVLFLRNLINLDRVNCKALLHKYWIALETSAFEDHCFQMSQKTLSPPQPNNPFPNQETEKCFISHQRYRHSYLLSKFKRI